MELCTNKMKAQMFLHQTTKKEKILLQKHDSCISTSRMSVLERQQHERQGNAIKMLYIQQNKISPCKLDLHLSVGGRFPELYFA